MLQEDGQSEQCLPVELLLRHVVQPESLTAKQSERVVHHLGRCPRCCDMFSALCDADEELWSQVCKAKGIPKPEFRPTRTMEEAWAETSRRIDACQAAERLKRRRTIVYRIGGMAAAACILIAIGIGWLALRNGGSDQTIPGITASPESPAAFAELVTDQGRKPLDLNQPITASDQPQEILLGRMHRVVMNRHTKATFSVEPQRTEGPHTGKVPYGIQLAQGELYVEVVPGNPFTVQTANARLDITGTRFDVVAHGDKTELTLLKGSVRFSALDHPREAVIVTAGHASMIAGRHPPIAPTTVDALATTAWARDTALRNAIAMNQNHYAGEILAGFHERELWRQPKLPDVDTLDYDSWLKEHPQPRFASRSLAVEQGARAGEGITVDWIELLMISGDIWQFHYDPKLPADQSLTKLTPQSIKRLARYYDLSEQDIPRALGLSVSALATMPVQDGTLGQRYAEALRRWHDAVMAAVVSPNKPQSDGSLKLFSLYASQYLAETRTATYLWAKNHPEVAQRLLTDREYLAMLPTPPLVRPNGNEASDVEEWLKQLRDQANAARNCVPAAMEWLFVPPGTGCPLQAREQQRGLAELIAELMPPPDQQEGTVWRVFRTHENKTSGMCLISSFMQRRRC